MRLVSDAFEHEQKIPSRYTCDGENISPPLRLEDVPEGTRSLVLIMDDPDVPKSLRADGVWDHWIAYNIPPTTREIPEGEEPPGLPGAGTAGNRGYFGPCPPDREHRYYFTVYALDTRLRVIDEPIKVEVLKAMDGHILERATLMGRYERVGR